MLDLQKRITKAIAVSLILQAGLCCADDYTKPAYLVATYDSPHAWHEAIPLQPKVWFNARDDRMGNSYGCVIEACDDRAVALYFWIRSSPNDPSTEKKQKVSLARTGSHKFAVPDGSSVTVHVEPAETRKIIYPVNDEQKFITPEDALFSYLTSVRRGDVSSSLNCFDFGFKELRVFDPSGMTTERANQVIAEHPERFRGQKMQEIISARITHHLDLLKTTTVKVTKRWAMDPLQYIFVIQYDLPDGRWSRDQVWVAKTRKGWRLENANFPDFNKR